MSNKIKKNKNKIINPRVVSLDTIKLSIEAFVRLHYGLRPGTGLSICADGISKSKQECIYNGSTWQPTKGTTFVDELTGLTINGRPGFPIYDALSLIHEIGKSVGVEFLYPIKSVSGFLEEALITQFLIDNAKKSCYVNGVIDPSITTGVVCNEQGTCSDVTLDTEIDCTSAGVCSDPTYITQSSCVLPANGKCSIASLTTEATCTVGGTCSDTSFTTQPTCNAAGTCSLATFTTKATCEAAVGECTDGAGGKTDGAGGKTDETTCTTNGGTWTAGPGIWTAEVWTPGVWTVNTWTSDRNTWTPTGEWKN